MAHLDRDLTDHYREAIRKAQEATRSREYLLPLLDALEEDLQISLLSADPNKDEILQIVGMIKHNARIRGKLEMDIYSGKEAEYELLHDEAD